MLKFEMEVALADTAERQIVGVIVPYGEVGRIAGVDYRFLPGSVKAARARTPLLLDHDRKSPVGVLEKLEETPQGATATFRVDKTARGDEALATAASGSRGALSVGASVEASVENDGVLDVTAGLVHEVSLLPLGAFASAEVTSVAAELEETQETPPPEPAPEPEPAPAEPEPAPDPPPAPPAPTPEEGTMTPEASAAAPVMIAARERPARAELQAGEMVRLIIEAQHGNAEARRYLEAALTESISTDVSGLLPPTYERTILGAKEIMRPLYDTFRSKPLPGVGLQVNKPKWTTPPNGAWAANVDADATSTKVVVGSQAATVQRWDWAGAIPWVVVQRSDPSIVDEIYAAAVQDWYYDVEAKIYGNVGAAAAGTSTKMGAAIAEFYVATGNTRAPEVIIMAPDVWGKFADAGQLAVSVSQGGASASGGELTTSYAGIRAIVSGTLPAGQVILATRRAVDIRVTDPVRLTANAIGALNVELAVVGEGLFDTDYPAELLKFAAIVPSAAELVTAKK